MVVLCDIIIKKHEKPQLNQWYVDFLTPRKYNKVKRRRGYGSVEDR